MPDAAWPGGRAPHKIGQDVMRRLEAERPKVSARTHEIIDEEIARWPGCLAMLVREYVKCRLRAQRAEKKGK